MATPLRALIIEDSEDDADLLVRDLERGGYQVASERVYTAEALQEALDRHGWDVIFADYTMPRFRGTEALTIVRDRGLEVPFMFVSGTIGEEVAVAAMKAGADDYFIKGKTQRLIPAVARELRDAAGRRERHRIEAERRAATEALRASEERHRLLFEHIADAILVVDRIGSIQFASAAVREVLGYEPEDLTGRSSLDLVHPADADKAREAFAAVRRRADGLESTEVRMRHSDGSWRQLDCVLRNLLHRPDIDGLVMTCRDVTERRRLEAEFLQVQKMESVGRLAGGIAHDFNNLLTAVTVHADLLLMQGGLSDQQQADIEQMREAGERAARLTRQLLAFSRRQVVDVRPLDINEVIGSLIQMLRRLLGEEIDVRTSLFDDVGTVRADFSQVEQMLVNLAVNARDAMPDGGRLAIETQNVDVDESYARLHPSVAPGRYVVLTVSDTGVGMDAETRAHIFEPFFSKKPPGEGTGLGLATTYGIVKQSGGHILVHSDPGSGATFRIYLPRVDEPAGQLPARAERGPAPSGRETVLLIEDEDAVRKLAARILRRQGYAILEANRAEDAMQWLADERRTIDLLLTDVVLPGISGKEIAARAKSLRPDLPVLFMSGYAMSRLTERGLARPDMDLLEKPFTASSLAWRVRDVLDAHRVDGSAAAG